MLFKLIFVFLDDDTEKEKIMCSSVSPGLERRLSG